MVPLIPPCEGPELPGEVAMIESQLIGVLVSRLLLPANNTIKGRRPRLNKKTSNIQRKSPDSVPLEPSDIQRIYKQRKDVVVTPEVESRPVADTVPVCLVASGAPSRERRMCRSRWRGTLIFSKHGFRAQFKISPKRHPD